jgi:hypothetical protein
MEIFQGNSSDKWWRLFSKCEDANKYAYFHIFILIIWSFTIFKNEKIIIKNQKTFHMIFKEYFNLFKKKKSLKLERKRFFWISLLFFDSFHHLQTQKMSFTFVDATVWQVLTCFSDWIIKICYYEVLFLVWILKMWYDNSFWKGNLILSILKFIICIF